MSKKLNRNARRAEEKKLENKIDKIQERIKRLERKSGVREIDPYLERGEENPREKFLEKKKRDYRYKGMSEEEAEEVVQEQRELGRIKDEEEAEKFKEELTNPMPPVEATFWVGRRRKKYRELKKKEEQFKETFPDLYQKTEQRNLSLEEKDKIYSHKHILSSDALEEVIEKKEKSGKGLDKLIEEKKIEKVNEFDQELEKLSRKIEKLEERDTEKAQKKKEELEKKARKIFGRLEILRDYNGGRYQIIKKKD